jgi:glycosyltransferase involved in cell wall biosynthesis
MFSLSIIIPSYNRASLVEKTLGSLIHQTGTDFQIILVDHGSTDTTEDVYLKYKDILPLSYYKIGRESSSPGAPRDFGVRKAEAPLILFVDSGSIVPSGFVEAHREFHRLHSKHVGIGPQLKNEDTDTDFSSLFAHEDLDEVYPLLKEAQFQDARLAVNLETSTFPWHWGWTANLSLPRDAYFAAGGFDLELQGWGYEDVDLCYRLSQQNMTIAFVEDGWCAEIPHHREGLKERMENNQRNMLTCYFKQRTLALESLNLTRMLLRLAVDAYCARTATPRGMVIASISQSARQLSLTRHIQQAEGNFSYLAALGQSERAPLSLPDQVYAQLARPTLLIGGTTQDSEKYDYVTLLDEQVISTHALWSCCGVLIPLADQALETVIVSDIWKQFDHVSQFPFDIPGVSLLELLLSEIQRTAKHAVFLDTQPESAGVTVDTLMSRCQHYNISFQIVSPEYVS